MKLIQITEQRGQVRGPCTELTAPNDGLIELHLEEHQRVVHVDWRRHFVHRNRSTVDWTWVATIESRL